MALLVALCLGAAPASAMPIVGEGAQEVRIDVVGAHGAIVAERVGQNSVQLENVANVWSGAFRGEPARFLSLRLWEADRAVWEGTVPLSDAAAEVLSFRMVDQTPNRPRTAERLAATGAVPVVGGVEASGALVGGVWAALVLLALGVGLRARDP